MTMLINDPQIEKRLIEERRARGLDQHDEVWEGVYFMSPLADNEHQRICSRFVSVLGAVLWGTGMGDVMPGANLAGFAEEWTHDFRCPDVVVVLKDTAAEDHDTHLRGGADFVVEVISPGDRAREKMPFYEKIGVREVLLVDRRPWSLELYRLEEGQLRCVSRCQAGDGQTATSRIVPLQFELLTGEPRPKIRVVRAGGEEQWEI